jgi:iron/zinc/copper transport system permease protein
MLSNFISGIGQYAFLQNALIAGVVIGAISGLIGSFSILQGTSLIGDAMSHAVLPGIAIAALLGLPFYLGAGIFGLLAAAVIYLITEYAPLKSDTAIGVTFSSFFALGTIIMTMSHATTRLTDILFGNILAVTNGDLIGTITVGLLVLSVIYIFFREFYLVTFDRDYAISQGIAANLFRQALILMLTLVIIVALQAVGVILVTALLITPAASARLLTRRFRPMMQLSMLFGVISAIVGLFMSYSFDMPSGPAIVLVGAVMFIFAFLIYHIRRLTRR